MTTTVFVPLMTAFSPPSSCFSPTYTDGQDTISSNILLGFQDQVFHITPGFTSSCSPSGASNLGQISADISTFGLFSPGICPSDYGTYSTSISASTTFATCCPPNWTLDGGQCTYSIVGGHGSVVVNGTRTPIALATVTMSPVAVAYQSSDLSLFAGLTATTSLAIATTIPGATISSSPAQTTSSTTATLSATTSSILFSPSANASIISGTPLSSSSVSTSESSVASQTGRSKPGLSTGAEAGIGIGVAVTALLCVGLGLFAWRRRKPSSIVLEDAYQKAELPGQCKEWPEFGVDEVYEADGTGRPPEVQGNVRAELESEWRGWEVS